MELGPERDGVSAFRIRGDELEGATLKGEARPEGMGWTLDIKEMDWFENWAEGWTEAAFIVEGRLELRPDGSRWGLAVVAPPKIENPISASIRLYGDYFEGDKALALLAHRWDRIQATDELLEAEISRRPGTIIPSPARYAIPGISSPVASRISRQARGPSCFPRSTATLREGRPADKEARVRAESIYWDTSYTKSSSRKTSGRFAIRARCTGFRGKLGLWRLDFCWDALWESKMGAAVFAGE